MPPRTYEIQSAYALGLVQLEEIVGWAVAALATGYDSSSLRILAGLEPPFDELEVKRLHSRSFAELGVRPLRPEAHVRYYIAHVLRSMLGAELGRKEAMHRLAGLHLDRSYDPQLRDFYLLYHAKSDL